jgi:hypothetical protein
MHVRGVIVTSTLSGSRFRPDLLGWGRMVSVRQQEKHDVHTEFGWQLPLGCSVQISGSRSVVCGPQGVGNTL